jgi:hypothetical protein
MNRIALLSLAVLAVAIPTLALGKPPPAQTHECLKDGAVLQKTKKECAKAGGTWSKMKPAAARPTPARREAYAAGGAAVVPT